MTLNLLAGIAIMVVVLAITVFVLDNEDDE